MVCVSFNLSLFSAQLTSAERPLLFGHRNQSGASVWQVADTASTRSVVFCPVVLDTLLQFFL